MLDILACLAIAPFALFGGVMVLVVVINTIGAIGKLVFDKNKELS